MDAQINSVVSLNSFKAYLINNTQPAALETENIVHQTISSISVSGSFDNLTEIEFYTDLACTTPRSTSTIQSATKIQMTFNPPLSSGTHELYLGYKNNTNKFCTDKPLIISIQLPEVNQNLKVAIESFSSNYDDIQPRIVATKLIANESLKIYSTENCAGPIAAEFSPTDFLTKDYSSKKIAFPISYGEVPFSYWHKNANGQTGCHLLGKHFSIAPSPIVKIVANAKAFAALKADGRVIAWGDSSYGGILSETQRRELALSNFRITDVFSNEYAFALLRENGSVISIGSASYGENFSAVEKHLDGTIPVTKIVATKNAFAAIRSDGSVVTWGDVGYGGSTAPVASYIDGSSKVTSIVAGVRAFAALREDGGVIIWGGTTTIVDLTANVQSLKAAGYAFAGLRANGSVKTWGGGDLGSDSSSVASKIDGTPGNVVVKLHSCLNGFAALRDNGSVVSWGASLNMDAPTANALDGTIDVVDISATGRAFAALRSDGSVIAWGHSGTGNDTTAVASLINGTTGNKVSKIFATTSSFAALRTDGTVVTWGSSATGGDSISVNSSLVNITDIIANGRAFAAIRSDGAVITWGDSAAGGDSSSVASSFDGSKDITSITATSTPETSSSTGSFVALLEDNTLIQWGSVPKIETITNTLTLTSPSDFDGSKPIIKLISGIYAHAGIREDGSVIAWGNPQYGGNISSVANLLDGSVDVTKVVTSIGAMAALRADGTVVTWGHSSYGGSPGVKAASLFNITQLYNSYHGFTAIKNDGTTINWGPGAEDSISPLTPTDEIIEVSATQTGYAALLSSGAVKTWGNASRGGDSSAVASKINGSITVTKVYGNQGAFAALRSNGSVVTWGTASFGGDSTSVADKINGDIPVIKIFNNAAAFAALRSDGSVVTWGNVNFGGNSSTVAAQLDGTVDVVDIASSSIMGQSFAALRADGTVVAWGNVNFGGDQSAIADKFSITSPAIKIVSTADAFAALKADGSVVAWGNSAYGGTINSTTDNLKGSPKIINLQASLAQFYVETENNQKYLWNGFGFFDITHASGLSGIIPITEFNKVGVDFVLLRENGSLVNIAY